MNRSAAVTTFPASIGVLLIFVATAMARTCRRGELSGKPGPCTSVAPAGAAISPTEARRQNGSVSVATGSQTGAVGTTKLSPRMIRKPQILLTDIPDQYGRAFTERGYDVADGRFGTPYVADPSGGVHYVPTAGELPNVDEREIAIVDTMCAGSPGAPPPPGPRFGHIGRRVREGSLLPPPEHATVPRTVLPPLGEWRRVHTPFSAPRIQPRQRRQTPWHTHYVRRRG